MTLVDANVLLHAVDASAELHVEARTWLDATPDLHETVALPWGRLQAFVRIATHVAAIALQHDARVATSDADLDRFPGVEWFRPGPP